jgi:uncharacterized membrane protein YdbT with pleckstrin-like domain
VRSVMSDVPATPGAAASSAAPEGATPRERPRLDLDRKFEASYRPTLLKNVFAPAAGLVFFSVAAVVILPFMDFNAKDGGEPFFWMVILALMNGANVVRRLLEVFCTTYKLGADDLIETYKFVATKTKRFTFDKVTAVVFSRGPIDRLLGTLTAKFFSIGSATTMDLRAIPYDEEIESQIAAKLGIRLAEPTVILTSRFQLGDLLRGRPAFAVLLAISLLGMGVAALAGAPLHWAALTVALLVGAGGLHQYLVARTARLELHDHSVLYSSGVAIKRRMHVTYDNVKALITRQYPMSASGDLKVDIAGEAMTEQAQKQQGEAAAKNPMYLVGNSFTMPFVENVMAEAFFFDCLQIDRPPAHEFADLRARAHALGKPKIVLESRPRAARLLVGEALVALICVLMVCGLSVGGGMSLWIGLGVSGLGIGILLCIRLAMFRAVRYAIEPGAVAIYAGLFIKSRCSITFDQIDFIAVKQGVLDRLLGTGTVLVHTTGSSKSELTLAGFADYEAFGKELTRHYEGYAPGVAANGMQAAP